MSKIFLLNIFLVLILLSSCTNSDISSENTDTIKVSTVFKRSKNVFYSIPSPVEFSMIIKSTGVQYNEEILNSTENAQNYTTNRSMALNTGIYGADLSYACLFDQQQTTLKYMAVVKELSKQLNILNAVSQEDIQKIEENIDKKEAIVKIISETFFKSDAYLKENERYEVATLISLGGWMEGLYIALKASQNSESANKEIVDRIMDQKLSLQNMKLLLETCSDKKEIADLSRDLNEIEAIYTKMTKVVEIEKMDISTNKKIKVNDTIPNVTPQNYIALCNLVERIRNSYVKLN